MTPDLVPISTVSRINTLVSCISIIIRPVWTGAPSSPIDTWGGISHKHTRARSTRPLSRVWWRARSSSAKYGHWKWNPSLAQFAGWRARAVASSCSVHYVMLCASYDMIPETKTYAICITTTVIYYDRYIYVIDWTFQFCTLFAHFTFANWQSMQSIILPNWCRRSARVLVETWAPNTNAWSITRPCVLNEQIHEHMWRIDVC